MVRSTGDTVTHTVEVTKFIIFDINFGITIRFSFHAQLLQPRSNLTTDIRYHWRCYSFKSFRSGSSVGGSRDSRACHTPLHGACRACWSHSLYVSNCRFGLVENLRQDLCGRDLCTWQGAETLNSQIKALAQCRPLPPQHKFLP